MAIQKFANAKSAVETLCLLLKSQWPVCHITAAKLVDKTRLDMERKLWEIAGGWRRRESELFISIISMSVHVECSPVLQGLKF